MPRLKSFRGRPDLVCLENFNFTTPSKSDIVEQSKLLCEDYIYSRLALALLIPEERQMNQSAKNGGPQSPTSDAQEFPERKGKVRGRRTILELDVSIEVQHIGAKLEDAYPQLYRNLPVQLSMPLRSTISIVKALTSIGDYMFRKSTVTWGRIIGLFAVAAAMAVECVRNGNGRLVLDIVIVFSQLIERHTADWIGKQGGWVAVLKAFRSDSEARYMWLLTVLGSLFGFVVTWYIPINFFELTVS